MMFKLSRITLVIVVFSALLISCKQKSETAKMIPSDALVVAYFDTKSMLDKLPFEDVKATQMYKDMIADTSIPAWGLEFLNDPKKAGIDIDKGIVFFTTKGTGGTDDFNFVMEGALSNAADFEKLNQNFDASQKIEVQKGIKLLSLKKNGIVAWNEKNFVYVFNSSAGGSEMKSWNEDSVMLPAIPEGNLDLAKSYAQRLFSLPSDSSLVKEDKFNSLMNQSGDVRVWLNSEQLFKLSPQLGMLGMLKLDALVKDSRATYVVNFGNGEITFDQKGYYGKEMTDLIKKYKGDAVKADDFTKIPSNDILGAAAFNFQPEGLKEGLKLMGLDGMINMYGSELGLTLDDLVGAIDGHILLSFSDLKMNKNPDSTSSFTSQMPDYNFLFKVGIKDKAKLQKVLDGVSKAMGIASANAFSMNDKEFVISNHKEFADSYLAGKSNNKPDWINSISGEPGGLYVNINKILSSIDVPADSLDNAMLQKSKAVWGEVFSKAGDISNNAFTASTRITFLDKITNSLKTLNTYFDEMYQLGKEQKKKWNTSTSSATDSTIILAPADTSVPVIVK